MGANLYHIQDNDRPMWVLASNYGEAVERWKQHIAPENECLPEDVEEPMGVSFVCDANDILTA